MKIIDKNHEQELLRELGSGNENAFSCIFNDYYMDLVLFCGNIIHNKETVEDIVQTVFLRLWDNRSQLNIEISLKSYLLKAVQNLCFDTIRHSQVKRNYVIANSEHLDWILNHDTENYILFSELQNHVEDAINKLPEKYRNVFMLGKIHGLKYSEISEKLSIPERKVELWMSKSLELMRNYLKEYLALIIFMVFQRM